MLYLLKNVNDGSIFYLVNKEEFIIGRRDCDLLIQNDQSISRKHALIKVKNNEISVTDLGSKYKTTYNGSELKPKVETVLAVNNDIHFGVMNSLYKLEQRSYVTSSTRLTERDKIKLNKHLAAIGGVYVDSWTLECTHLTSKEMNLTVKVLHALLDQKFIVTPAFWSKFAENVSKNIAPPNELEFGNLDITEPLLNKADLSINPIRKTLFEGKVFLFLKEKNKKQMEDIIQKAGGVSKSWEKEKMPISDVINSPKDFLVIQVPFQEEVESFNEVIKGFSKIGKRTIPLSEIALAILMCNTERFCNPQFKLVEQVFATKPTCLPTQNALAMDTQSECFTVPCKMEDKALVVIPDTFENQLDLTAKAECEKRDFKTKEKPVGNDSVITVTKTTQEKTPKRSNDDVAENPFKKMKAEFAERAGKKGQQKRIDVYLTKNDSEKRRADDSMEIEESQSPKEKNPFAAIKKKVKIDAPSKDVNPFALIKRQTENISAPISEDNLFKTFARRPVERKKTNTNNNKSPENSRRTSDYSGRTSDYNRNISLNINIEKSWELDNTWYSKTSHKNRSPIKTEKNIDSEIQEYIDMFKDKIVIDVLKVVAREIQRPQDVTDGTLGGVKNYKKFKKVKPLRCQTTIISKDTFIEVVPTTNGLVCNRQEHADSDDEIDEILNNRKRAPKKFAFSK